MNGKMEQQLERAIRALDKICETAADTRKSYPERLGAMEMEAAIALDYLGRPDWYTAMSLHLDEFLKNIRGDKPAADLKDVCPQRGKK